MKWFTVVVVSTILSLPFAFWYSLPISWRRWFVGIKKLLTLLILVRLHSFRIKIWNYSFIDDFEASVDASPERDLFIEVESGRHISMQEVEGLANQVARYLVSEGGVKQKDTVALMMTNRFELVAVWLGIGKAGCSCALLNTNARGLTLEHALQVSSAESHSKLFVIERELHCQLLSEQLVALTDKGVNILIWEDLFLILSNLSQMRPSKSLRNAVIERDVLLYIFTSGTTGLPKASKISHSRVWIGSLPLAVLCDLQPGERVYTTLPLYHSAGGLLGVGACIRYKGCMVLRKKFSAKNFASDCHKYRCAVFQYIGELCRYLCATPPQPLDGQLSLRCAFGNGLRPEIWEQFQHKYRIKHIVEFFLATEANVGMFNCFDRVGALGYIPRWADLLYPVFLVKPDPENKEIPLRGSINNGSNRVSSSISDKGFCQVCPANEPGLVISSINEKRFDRRFDGYSDEKASKKKVLTDVFRVGDRYFNTGDLMTRDADGYFFWSDRAGDTYRWKGENISTAEVGEVIGRCNFVADVAVYGVQVPNCEGRAGMVALVPQSSSACMSSSDSDLSAVGTEQFAAFPWTTFTQVLMQHLPAYSRPMFVRLTHKIHTTATFKHLRAELVEEGFNPSRVRDDALFMWDGSKYVPLTAAVYDDIVNGRIRM